LVEKPASISKTNRSNKSFTAEPSPSDTARCAAARSSAAALSNVGWFCTYYTDRAASSEAFRAADGKTLAARRSKTAASSS
jgi:ethanolamine ammonia-lyase large subunit